LCPGVPSSQGSAPASAAVFLRVIRHAGSLRSTDRPEAWLFQIARNALRDALRARLRRDGRNDTIESDDDLAAEPDAAAEDAAGLGQARSGRRTQDKPAQIPAVFEVVLFEGKTLTRAQRSRHISVTASQ
jgi:DNA-directed RNA polymerase specialized sigma24 family protein